MDAHHHDWALVLAAGHGRRLARLTTDSNGRVVPKQFCSLDGGPSLLQQAIRRAARVVPLHKVVVVVAEEHEVFWPEHCAMLPRRNVVIQPQGRGTAAGILLPLSFILDRDPAARVLVLPSDHHVVEEATLATAMRSALTEAGRDPQRITMLGMQPEDADPQYGWIVPGERDEGRLHTVRAFIEKPDAAGAVELERDGGLWNSFILAVEGRGLVDLYAHHLPQLLATMRAAFLAQCHRGQEGAIARAYESLPDSDFSRDLVQHCPRSLRLLSVEGCGWSDLGTPARVEQVLRRRQPRRPRLRVQAGAPLHGFRAVPVGCWPPANPSLADHLASPDPASV